MSSYCQYWYQIHDKMYSLWGVGLFFTSQPITCLSLPSEEFTRAVYVATGIKLTRHLVNTIFKIFDEDHDDKLSHKEFIGIMKDRLHRGEGVRMAKSLGCLFSFNVWHWRWQERSTRSAHSPPNSSASESNSFEDWGGGEEHRGDGVISTGHCERYQQYQSLSAT